MPFRYENDASFVSGAGADRPARGSAAGRAEEDVGGESGVEDALRQLNLADKPRITISTKVDQIPDAEGKLDSSLEELASLQSSLTENIPGAVLVSAEKRWGLDLLRACIVEALDREAGSKAEAQRAQTPA